MSEMIERVAAAYAAERGLWFQRFEHMDGLIFVHGIRVGDDGADAKMMPSMSFHDFEAEGWKTWAELRDHASARAAIQAMREPTEAMIDAGDGLHDQWTPMIDEALK